MPHTVEDLVAVWETIAPIGHAAEWDNVGLLVGSSNWTFHGALLTIDLTMDVLLEAEQLGAGAIIAYHPPIFSGLKRFTADDPASAVVLQAAAARTAVFSPHTALDAVPGGMTDWLADGIGVGETCPLQSATELGSHEQCKVVTYVPHEALDAVRTAMGDAGAGTIGDYTHCSTSIENEGTFIGGVGSDPAVGSAGQLERVTERRLMMVSSIRGLAGVLAALRAAHPYEEPPVHVVPLADRPMHDTGIGRCLALAEPKSTADIVASLKAHLGVSTLRVAEGSGGPASHDHVGLCPGAGSSLLDEAAASGCTLFVTGEMRHHDVLAARDRGITVILAGHTNTERGYLPRLRDRLAGAMPGCEFTVSSRDCTPWVDA